MCGPSGAGKSTLIGMLRKEFPDDYGFSVSHTTRGPRAGEQDGVDYYFVEKAAMEREIAEGKFLETAHVHGNIYGTSFGAVNQVSAKDKICILDIDIQVRAGARALPAQPPTQLMLPRRRGDHHHRPARHARAPTMCRVSRAARSSTLTRTSTSLSRRPAWATLRSACAGGVRARAGLCRAPRGCPAGGRAAAAVGRCARAPVRVHDGAAPLQPPRAPF